LQDPRNTRALYGLGMLLAQKSPRSPRAFEFFTRALQTDPAFVAARRARANILALCGEFEQAREEIDWCVKVDPSGVTLYAGACVYALASAKGSTREHARVLRRYALDLLREAFKRGYGRDRAEEDSDLESLRNDPELRRLLSAGK